MTGGATLVYGLRTMAISGECPNCGTRVEAAGPSSLMLTGVGGPSETEKDCPSCGRHLTWTDGAWRADPEPAE